MDVPAEQPRRRQVLLALAAGSVSALAGCAGRRAQPGTAGGGAAPTLSGTPGGGAQTPAGRGTHPPTTEPSGPAGQTPTDDERPRDEVVVATSVVDRLQVHAEPADLDDPGDPAGEAVERVLDRRDEVSGQVVLLALETGREWVHVQLPVRPNGSTGFVRRRDVGLASHRFSVTVTLSTHELVVTRAGREVLRSAIGVGTQDTPTPGGGHFVKELLAPPDPTGVYGPYAYGLSGYSTVLTDFAGGDGVIGIHGTDRPDLVGTDVSSGCIRLPNDVITSLVEEVGLPLGTPVAILA